MLRSTAPTSIQSQLSAPSSPTLSSSCSWLEPSHSHFKAFPQFFYLERCFLLLASSFLVDRVQFKWNVLQGASSDHLVRGSHLPTPSQLFLSSLWSHLFIYGFICLLPAGSMRPEANVTCILSTQHRPVHNLPRTFLGIFLIHVHICWGCLGWDRPNWPR